MVYPRFFEKRHTAKTQPFTAHAELVVGDGPIGGRGSRRPEDHTLVEAFEKVFRRPLKLRSSFEQQEPLLASSGPDPSRKP